MKRKTKSLPTCHTNLGNDFFCLNSHELQISSYENHVLIKVSHKQIFTLDNVKMLILDNINNKKLRYI